MKEIVATGKHEVKITLAAPNADLPVILGTYHFLIAQAGTTDFSKGIARPVQVQGIHAGCALHRGAKRELLETGRRALSR